jgi:hypothetical protein
MASIAVIRARRAEIAQQLARLRAEDDELAVVEQVLRRFDANSAEADGVAPLRAAARAASRHSLLTPRSQREYVLDALANADHVWLRSDQIVALARKRWGVSILESSLRPLLSVMKRDGQVVRQGRVLALPERVEEARKAAVGSRQ